MAAVKPIKNKAQEKDLIDYLASRDERMLLFYLISRFTGFRVGGIVPLRVRNVKTRSTLFLSKRRPRRGGIF